jgi:hypothetical protein
MTPRNNNGNKVARAPVTGAAHDARGAVRVEMRGGVLKTEIRGYLGAELAQRLSEALQRQIQPRSASFHDWAAMTGYDPNARKVLARVLEEGRARGETTHILLGSSLAGMGISVAATLLGQSVQCHTNRQRWTEAAAQAEQKNGAEA